MRRPAVPWPLIAVTVVFAAVLVFVVVSALVPHRVATFAVPTSPHPHVPPLVVDTVTIAAGDPERWQFFSVTRGLLTAPDTAGWDLAVRRFHVIVAPGGEAIRLDAVPFDTLAMAPAGGYVATSFTGDTTNPAFARWYRYSMFSHLLTPDRAVFVVHGRDDRYTKLEILSYYCPGPEPGCLTFRYLSSPPGSAAFR